MPTRTRNRAKRGKSPTPTKKSATKKRTSSSSKKKAGKANGAAANGNGAPATTNRHDNDAIAADAARARRLADLSAWQLLARGHVARAVWRAAGGPLLSKQGAHSLILWSYLSDPDPSLLAPWPVMILQRTFVD